MLANGGINLSLADISDMIPWERDIMVEQIKNRNEEIRRQQQQ